MSRRAAPKANSTAVRSTKEPTTIVPRYGDLLHDGGLQPHQAPSHDLLAD